MELAKLLANALHGAGVVRLQLAPQAARILAQELERRIPPDLLRALSGDFQRSPDGGAETIPLSPLCAESVSDMAGRLMVLPRKIGGGQ